MLFCFLTATTLLVAIQQRNLLHEDTYNHAVENLDLMADASLEALLKSDYVTVRTFVKRWGESHKDISEIRAVAPNSYVLAEYRNPVQGTAEVYSLSKKVLIDNKPVATIYLVGDFRYAEEIAVQLRNRLFVASLIITALLGVALWFNFRRLALAPLEHMVDERTRALSVSNQELEQEVGTRIRTETALRDQEEELSAIFSNAPYLMILLDQDRRVVRGNSVSFENAGKSHTDMAGIMVGEALRCINSLNVSAGCGFGPNCATCLVRNSVLDTMETGRNHYQIEARLKTKDGGHDKEIAVLMSTAHLSLRKQSMVLVSMHDITENRRLEAQLRQSQKMESIGQFAGGIAHDFNNILSVILGYGEIILADMADDDPLRLKLGHIIDAGNRAAHLTKDLLLFSRKQTLEKSPVDLNEIIKKMEKFIIRIIGEDIACNTALQSGELPVFADAHQFEQVMMNLATNARDSMPNGGRFTITTESVLLDEEFTSMHGLGMPGRYALICISDTGQGMNEETRQRIFDPFFTTKEVGKGTGLGLAVVYGIIRQHEGYINVYSEPGMGTTFRIYLPAMESRPVIEKELSEMRPPERGTETILLAEDDETVRNIFLTGLRNFGYTVIEAVNGEEAVHKYKENKDSIELLIFDLIMPVKSGKEAYDEIRMIRPDIKIIFVTGYSPDIVRIRASIENAAAILFKPFSSKDLMNKVRSVLDEDRTY